MTKAEKLLLLLCMIMVMVFSIIDILTLYNAVCWQLIAELSVFAVSAVMCYTVVAEKL